MSKIENFKFNINGVFIPVKLISEKRRNSRISIGQKEVIIRLPLFMNKHDVEKQLSEFKVWLDNIFKKKPHLILKFRSKIYVNNQYYKVGNKEYTLSFSHEIRKSLKAAIENKTIKVTLPKSIKLDNDYDIISKLISKIVAQDQYEATSKRIHYLNNHFFHVEIKDIKLKHNTSNWGSCSSKGNINISTRLLFAPHSVQDYVFIHELAHFLEMNHSKKFWKIVYDIMPDYKEKEKWLKANSHLCQY